MKALTIEELKYLVMVNDGGVHIWVRKLAINAVYAAITDKVDGVGVVAVWCAGSEEYWLREVDYGTTWVAYSEKPTEDDDYDPNYPAPHLNGMGYI